MSISIVFVCFVGKFIFGFKSFGYLFIMFIIIFVWYEFVFVIDVVIYDMIMWIVGVVMFYDDELSIFYFYYLYVFKGYFSYEFIC